MSLKNWKYNPKTKGYYKKVYTMDGPNRIGTVHKLDENGEPIQEERKSTSLKNYKYKDPSLDTPDSAAVTNTLEDLSTSFTPATNKPKNPLNDDFAKNALKYMETHPNGNPYTTGISSYKPQVTGPLSGDVNSPEFQSLVEMSKMVDANNARTAKSKQQYEQEAAAAKAIYPKITYDSAIQNGMRGDEIAQDITRTSRRANSPLAGAGNATRQGAELENDVYNSALLGNKALGNYELLPTELETYYYIVGAHGKEEGERYLERVRDSRINPRIAKKAYADIAETTGVPGAVGRMGIAALAGLSSAGKSIASAPQFANGGTDVPARSVAENMGALVQQDPNNKVRTATELAQNFGTNLPSQATGLMFGPNAGSSVLALQMGAGAYREAINEGRSVGEAQMFGTMQAVDEYVTNQLLNGTTALGGSVLQRTLKNTKAFTAAKAGLRSMFTTPTMRTVVGWGMDQIASMSSEAAQEFLQYFTEELERYIAFGETDLDLSNPKTWEEAGHDAWIGALNALAMNVPATAVQGVNTYNAGKYAGMGYQDIADSIRPTAGQYTDRNVRDSARNVYDMARDFQAREADGKKVSFFDRGLFEAAAEDYSDAVMNYNREHARPVYEEAFPNEDVTAEEAAAEETTAETTQEETAQEDVASETTKRETAADYIKRRQAENTARQAATQAMNDVASETAKDTGEAFRNANYYNSQRMTAGERIFNAEMAEDMASTFGEEGQKAFSALPAEEGVKAYREWAAHYNNMRFGMPIREGMSTTLSPEQISAAMRAGALDANRAYPQDTMRAVNRAVNKISVNGVNAGNTDLSGIDYKSLTPQQKLRVDYTSTFVTKGLGMDVRYVKSEAVDGRYKGMNGSFQVINGRPTITLDVNAGMNRESDWTGDITDIKSMLPVISHETTHFLEQYNPKLYKELSNTVLTALQNNGTYSKGMTINSIIEAERQRLNDTIKDENGKPVQHTQDDAIHELVARACEDMLSGDKKALDAFNSLDANTKQTLWDHVKQVFDNIREFFSQMLSSYKSDSAEAKAIRQNMEEFEKIRDMWMNALDGSHAEDIGINIDTATESAAPTGPELSYRSWNASDWVQYKKEAAKELADALGVSTKTATKYINDVNSVAKMIFDDQVRLDYDSSEGRSAFVSNTEYGGSIDFSTLCKKRLLYTGTIQAIQNLLPNTALTPAEYLQIRQMMLDAGYEVTCGLCYVEGSRVKMGVYTKEFIEKYKKTNPEYVPTMAEMNTPDGQEKLRSEHPEVYDAYVYFMNHYGTLSKGEKALFASQQKPKLYTLRTEYKGEIKKKFGGAKNRASVADKNLNGGLRIQSFSDFEIVHMIDMMQVIMDMSEAGLAGQAYTKVPEFADSFGRTGLKINCSLIAKGVDENGKLIFDDREGMNHERAFELRDKYSKNVGTVLVVFNQEQLRAALADDRIDYVLPFHKSQWTSEQYDAIGLPEGTIDFTNYQNDYIKGAKSKENVMPMEYWDFSKSGRENAERYLQICAEEGRTPKFARIRGENLLIDNGDGTWSLPDGPLGDGYFKLLIDFKMYDNNGKGARQMPVRPNFSMDEIRIALNDYKGGHRSFPVANDIVQEFVDNYKKQNPRTEYSTRDSQGKELTESQAEYFKDSKVRDAEGNLKVMYHGTERGGFTVFDPAESDDGISLFFTDYSENAREYSGSYDEITPDRRMSESELFDMIENITEGDFQLSRTADGYAIEEYTLDDEGNFTYKPKKSFKTLKEAQAYAYEEFVKEGRNGGYGTIPGNYAVYLNLQDPLVVDAQDSSWSEIPYWENDDGELEPATTKEIAEDAKEQGYDGVIINNVFDNGKYAERQGVEANIAIAFSSNQVKSVYNENPTENSDIRYSTRDIEEAADSDDRPDVIRQGSDEDIQFSARIADKNLDNRLRVNMATFFSGTGTVDFALRNIVRHEFAVENDAKIAAVYRANNGDNIYVDDVRNVNIDSHKGKVEYFHASPVCKSYSKANNDMGEKPLDIETARATANAIRTLQPKVVTVENVARYRNSEAVKIIEKALEGSGYDYDVNVYSATDFGGATIRQRMFIRAVKDGVLPEVDTSEHARSWYSVVEDLIPELPEAKLSNYMEERLEPSGIDIDNLDQPVFVLGGEKSGKLTYATADKPAPTLLAKSTEAKILMPDGRVLRATPRVMARIQGLPDGFDLMEKEQGITNAYKIVGNGVPVQLTQGIVGPLLEENLIRQKSEATGVQYSQRNANISEAIEKRQRRMEEKYLARIDRLTAKSDEKIDKLKAKMRNAVGAEKQKAKDRLDKLRKEKNDKIKHLEKAYRLNLDWRIAEMRQEMENAVGAEKQKARERLDALRTQKNQQIDDIISEYRETRLRERLKRRESKAQQELLRRARRLAGMKGDPDFRAQVDALIGDLDLVAAGIRDDTQKKLEEIRKQVEAQSELDPDYAKYEAPKYAKLLERPGKKHISQMSIEDILQLTESIVALEHSKRTADHEIGKERRATFGYYGKAATEQLEKTKGINYKNEIGAQLGKYKLNMLNPTRAFSLIDGYQRGGVFTYFGKELNDGQTKAAQFRMEVEKMFQDIDNNPKLVNDFAKQDIEIDTLEGKKKISKGMRIALYLHLQNPDNVKHIAFGGITIPNEKLYSRGKYAEAYAAGETVHLSEWDPSVLGESVSDTVNRKNDAAAAAAIRKITDQMTPEEKEYADIAYKFFNETTKDAINEVSLALNGYEKAIVDDYFPISTNKNFLQSSYDGLVKDGTLEGMGMLKERSGSRLPIYLEDASQVVLRQKNNTALYYGLAVPIRNFTRFYNYTGGERLERSVKASVGKTWGKTALDYIDNVLSDLQFGRQTQRNITDTMKSIYAGTTLNLNLGVAIKQSASYPFAASVIGWGPLAKAARHVVSKADREYMDSITPWGYMRRTGFSGTEMGEVAKQRTGIDNNRLIQRTKTALDLIRRVDVKTTEVLFFACEDYVKEKYPDLEVRGEEYNRKLAEVYNETLQRTQPSYDVMQRNEFLRSQNDLAKIFGAFKTQTFNMGGEVIDAWSRWRAYSEYAKTDSSYKEAKREAAKAFGNTVAATIVAQGMLVILSAAANAVLHKMRDYRDEKGEITAESLAKKILKDFGTSFAGLTMGGSEAQDFALALLGDGKWYDIDYPGLTLVNDFASATVDFRKAASKAVETGNEQDMQKASAKMAKLIMQMFKLKGVPSQNLYNIVNAIYLWGTDYKNGQLGSFEAGQGLFGLQDTSPSKDQYAKQALDAYKNGDTKKGDRALEKAGESAIKKEIGGRQEDAAQFLKGSGFGDTVNRKLWEGAGWKLKNYDKNMK